jgi:hypothetical protein
MSILMNDILPHRWALVHQFIILLHMWIQAAKLWSIYGRFVLIASSFKNVCSYILGAGNGFLMEVCVDSVESAVNAERGGKEN